MQKFIRKLLIPISIFSLLITQLQVVIADEIDEQRGFTPQNRATVEFVEGETSGLDYVTFNSFTSNPKIAAAPQRGDERDFMLGKFCAEGECLTNASPECNGDNPLCDFSEYPSNQGGRAFQPGDKVRFEIYFHNNADDPFDGDNNNPEQAQNVKIGVVVSDDQLGNPFLDDGDDVLRPRGFIEASNATYRTDINDPDSTLLEFDGSPIRKVTDEIQMLLQSNGLKLEPVSGSSGLYFNNRAENFELDINLDTPKSFELPTPEGGGFKMQAQERSDDNSIWIEMPELPGCFGYSGFAYFDAIVVAPPEEEPPVCQNLDIEQIGTPSVNNEGQYVTAITVNDISFEGETPEDAVITWIIPDTEATVLDAQGNELEKTTTGNDQLSLTSVSTPASEGIGIRYRGEGELIAASVDNDPNCTDTVNFRPVCKSFEAVATGNTDGDKKELRINNLEYLPETPNNVAVEWVTIDPEGEFFLPNDDTVLNFRSNTASLASSAQTVFYRGEGPVVIKPIHQGLSPLSCASIVRFDEPPEEPALCRNLLVDHNDPIYTGVTSTFNSRSISTEDQQFEGQIRYSVDSSNGENHGVFFDFPPAGVPLASTTDSVFVRESALANNADVFRNFVRTPVDLDLTANSNQDPAPDLQAQVELDLNALWGMAFNAQAGNNFQIPEQQDLIQPPVQLELPEIQPELPTPPEPRNPFGANAFGAFGNGLPAAPELPENGPQPDNISPVQPVNIREVATTPDLLLDRLGELQIALQGQTSLTTNPNEDVYFVGLKSGNNVVHVEQLDTEGNVVAQAACSRDFSIEDLPVDGCTSLTTTITERATGNQVQQLDIATSYTVSSQADFTDNDEVTYEINENFGTFLNPENNDIQNWLNIAPEVLDQYLSSLNNEGNLTLASLQERLNVPDATTQELTVSEGTELILVTFGSTESLNLPNVLQANTEATQNQACQNGFPLIAEGQAPVCTNLQLEGLLNSSGVEVLHTVTVDQLPADQAIEVFTIQQCQIAKVGENNFDTFLTFSKEELDENNQIQFLSKCTNYNSALGEELQVRAGDSCFAQDNLLPAPIDEEPVCRNTEVTGNFDVERDSELTVEIDQLPVDEDVQVTVDNPHCTINKPGENTDQRTVIFENEEVGADNRVNVIVSCDHDDLQDNERVTVTATVNDSCQGSISDRKRETNPEELCRDLDIISPDSPWELDGDDEVRFRIDVETNPRNLANDLDYEWEVTRGDGEWEENGRDRLVAEGDFTQILEDPDEDTVVRVTALDEDGDEIRRCSDSIRVNDNPERDDEPEIEKFVSKNNGSNRSSLAADQDDTINYTIKFTPGENTDAAFIKDSDLRGGQIESEERNLRGSLDIRNLTISIAERGSNRTTEIYESEGRNSFNRRLEDNYSCSEDDNFRDGLRSNGKICIADYEDVYSDFTNGREVEFYNLQRLDSDEYILIEYEMANNTVITAQNCQELPKGSCGETFRNSAEYESFEYEDTENEIRRTIDEDDFEESLKDLDLDREDTGRDSTSVTVTCPFHLTRNGGDAIFEGGDLTVSLDLSKCTPVENTTGLTIVPRTPRRIIEKSGPDQIDNEGNRVLSRPTNDICQFSNSENNVAGFSNALKNFSSSVCELDGEVAQAWKISNINEQIEANLTRVTRWGDNLNNQVLTNMASLPDSSGVYAITDKDLVINGDGGVYSINGQAQAPAAQTYIVKDADLIINSNIKYASGIDITNPGNTPSVAFIVLNGNIQIAPEVTHIDGILMAVDLGEEEDGKILSGSGNQESSKQLRINGSLSGDVNDIFAYRRPLGLDALKNEGAVAIFYDQRILLNPAPGLSDFLNIQQAIVPN